MGQRPAGSDDRWLDDGAVYTTANWQALTHPSLVEWDGHSGIRWRVGIAIDAESLTPGIATLRAESIDGGRPNLAAVNLAAVETQAISLASHINFGPPSGQFPMFPLSATCRQMGKASEYYIRRITDPGGVEAQILPRRNAPDYRQAAVEYLAAVDAGEDPVVRLMRRTDCPSKATARKWFERAAKQGWLTDAPAIPGARRAAGPRLLEA